MSFNKEATVPAGRLLNAPSVGAKTVNGPGPDKVPSREQAIMAVFNAPIMQVDHIERAVNCALELDIYCEN